MRSIAWDVGLYNSTHSLAEFEPGPGSSITSLITGLPQLPDGPPVTVAVGVGLARGVGVAVGVKVGSGEDVGVGVGVGLESQDPD